MTNTSGLRPLEFNLIVKQDEVAENTKGGLVKPVELVEKEKHAQTRGVIVAVAPMAFNDDILPDSETKPKAGDRIAWTRYAGGLVEGTDGEEYRVIKDKDVVAMIEA